MERFVQLFADFLCLVYHCFDRIVIHGYLSGLSRPEQVVYFFRQVLGIPVVSKEVLSQRTNDYRDWVEAYARSLVDPTGPWGGFARETVNDWLDVLERAQPAAERRTRAGLARRTAALALLRGSLLDMLATGDARRVSAGLLS